MNVIPLRPPLPTAVAAGVSSARSRLLEPFRRHLAAVSQTFFVESWRTGLGMLVILGVAAPRLAIGALVGSIVARATATSAGASRNLLATGLVELNGWFLGLACATFYGAALPFTVALLAGSSLTAILCVVLQRVLSTWDLPLLVAPYVPAFWLLWSGLASFAWGVPGAAPSPLLAEGSTASALLVAGLRGVGQIAFLPDARVGVALALAASLADFRLGPCLVACSVASVSIGHFAGAPGWQTAQGLAGFSAALIAAAALRGFARLRWQAVAATILFGPFLEASALRVLGAAGLPALSSVYVGLVWMLALMRPVRESAALGTSWSARSTARVFEN